MAIEGQPQSIVHDLEEMCKQYIKVCELEQFNAATTVRAAYHVAAD